MFFLLLSAAGCGAGGYRLREGLVLPLTSRPSGYAPPVSAQRGVELAAASLKRRGVKDLTICAFSWIEAPFGGMLIDATGELEKGDAIFGVFRVGVLDGSEAEDSRWPAGGEFVFVARGRNIRGERVWLPPPSVEYQGALEWAPYGGEIDDSDGCWVKPN